MMAGTTGKGSPEGKWFQLNWMKGQKWIKSLGGKLQAKKQNTKSKKQKNPRNQEII